MAKINGTSGEIPSVKKLIELSEKVIANNREIAACGSSLHHVVAMESSDPGVVMASSQSYSAMASTVATQMSMGMAEAGLEELTPAQLAAGAMIVAASSDLRRFHEAAADENYGMDGNSDVISTIRNGVGGRSDIGQEQVALEYYNDTALERTINYSFALNVNASRQDDFNEAFFRTLTIDPSEGGIAIQVDTTRVHREARYSADESTNIPYTSRNILDAGSDPTVLEDRSVKFVPYVNPDGSNEDNFISSSIYPVTTMDVAGTMVPTAPLNPTKEIKVLKSLAAHPGLVSNSVLDTSDELNTRIKLAYLQFAIKESSEADSAAKVVVVNTANLPRASFNKAPEGDARDYQLTFSDAKFSLSDATRDITGSVIGALDGLSAAGYTMTYTVSLMSTINVSTGNEKIMVSSVQITRLMDVDGMIIDHTTGSGKTLIDALSIKLVGYDYEASFSNSNRRAQGILSNSESVVERIKVGLGSPLTSRKPMGANGDMSGRLNDLMVMARFRTMNLGITKLLNYTETLAEVVAATTDPYEIVSIEGAGRHYVAPWFESYTVDVTTITASLDNIAAEKNLREALLGIIRNQVTRAYRESRLKVATDYLMPGTSAFPKVIIGTDSYTAAYLQIDGETRILGNQFEYEIVVTNDIRFEGRIQWIFQFDGSTEGQAYNPLNFAYHLFVPELVTDVQLTRNGSTSQELTVQPRNEHFVSCPITGVVMADGIKEFVTSKPGIHTTGLSVTIEDTPDTADVA